MSLPKIEQPLFKLKLPSTQQEVMVRPMLVKEEKILLMAKEGDDPNDILLAIKQVVNNCLQSEDVRINDLTLFDIEYLFLKIRAFSVDNIVKLTLTDEDDEKERTFEIDLNSVDVEFPNSETMISIGKDSGLELKWPTADIYERIKESQISKEKNESEMADKFTSLMIAGAIAKYYDGESVYDMTKETPENVSKFVDENLSPATYYKIVEFIDNMPTLKHTIKYTNDEGKEKVTELSSLNHFFMF